MTTTGKIPAGFRKSSFSGSDGGGQDSGGNCVYLNGGRTTALDSKSGVRINVAGGMPVRLLASLRPTS